MKSLTVSFLATAAHSFHFATLQNRLFNSKRFHRSEIKRLNLQKLQQKIEVSIIFRFPHRFGAGEITG